MSEEVNKSRGGAEAMIEKLVRRHWIDGTGFPEARRKTLISACNTLLESEIKRQKIELIEEIHDAFIQYPDIPTWAIQSLLNHIKQLKL